jgi:bifunctional ADP-heptose synthase (sugar kinase/adenylyltransferase)
VHCFTNGPATDAPANVRHTALDAGALIETRFVEAGRPVFKTKSVGLSGVVFDGLPRFDDYDLVIIADFGHGLLDAATLNQRIAERTTSTVAAMAQVNSSNYGYNLPIKYAGADYYSLNRTEAELSLHERHQTLEGLATHSARLLKAEWVSVTDGDNGVMVVHRDERYALPSLSASVVDTIGCGDAYLALSSIGVRLNLPPNLVALVGSIGAAAMTQRRCNESAVTETEFMTIGKIVI